MSAAIAEFESPLHSPRHLSLVPQLLEGCVDGVSPHLRITRRGRLVRTVGIVLVIASLAAAAMLMVSPASATIEVQVKPGQTLSEIASTHLPSMPLDRAMVAVQIENNLNSAQLQAGQRIVIP